MSQAWTGKRVRREGKLGRVKGGDGREGWGEMAREDEEVNMNTCWTLSRLLYRDLVVIPVSKTTVSI